MSLNREEVIHWLKKQLVGWQDLSISPVEEGVEIWQAEWYLYNPASYEFGNYEANTIVDEWLVEEVGRRLGFPVEKVEEGTRGNGHDWMVVKRKK